MNLPGRTRINLFIALLILIWTSLTGQGTTYWVSTDGKDTNPGSKAAPLRTINYAATIARAGDTVMVRPGVYRERVKPLHEGTEGHPIVYISEELHEAVIKGSEPWEPEWRLFTEGIYGASPDPALFTDDQYVDGGNPYEIAYAWRRTPEHLVRGGHRPPYPYDSVSWTLGQVFVNGRQWKEVSSMEELVAEEGTWFYHAHTREIRIHFGENQPDANTFEITTRRGVFRPVRPGLGHIHLIGFVIEHCGNQFPYRFYDASLPQNAQSGIVGTRGGHHWVIRDNIIRHAKSIGIDMGGLRHDNELHAYPHNDCRISSHHQITGNVIHANGSAGIMGLGLKDVVISDNVIVENNLLKNTEYEYGGIKTHFATRLVVENNWFVNNETVGVWLDNSWKHCRVTRNVFIGNRGHDMFYELDDNTFENPTIVDHNVMLGGRAGYFPRPDYDGQTEDPWAPWNCGIYTHDADGLIILHNLFARHGYGIYSREITSRRGSESYRKIFGNIFAGESLRSICYPVDYEDLVKENYIFDNVYPARSDTFIVHGLVSPTGFLPEALEQVHESWCRHGCPGPSGELSAWGPPGKVQGYFVDFEQWRCITGFDTESRQMDMEVSYNGTLTITLPSPLTEIESRYVQVDRDFFGKTFPERPLPGPIQELKAGINEIPLLPENSWLTAYMKEKGIIQ